MWSRLCSVDDHLSCCGWIHPSRPRRAAGPQEEEKGPPDPQLPYDRMLLPRGCGTPSMPSSQDTIPDRQHYWMDGWMDGWSAHVCMYVWWCMSLHLHIVCRYVCFHCLFVILNGLYQEGIPLLMKAVLRWGFFFAVDDRWNYEYRKVIGLPTYPMPIKYYEHCDFNINILRNFNFYSFIRSQREWTSTRILYWSKIVWVVMYRTM